MGREEKSYGFQNTIPFAEEFLKAEAKRQKEHQRVIEKKVQGMSPEMVASEFQFKVVDTYCCCDNTQTKEKSSKAIIIINKHNYDIVQIACRINGWDDNICKYGCVSKKKDNTYYYFSEYRDLEHYQKYFTDYFSNNKRYHYESKDSEEDNILCDIRDAYNMEEVRDFLEKYDDFEDGYYDEWGCLIIADDDLGDNFFSCNEDDTSYYFGLNFTDEKYFSTGKKSE